VEDWFQVENFKPWIAYETWPQRELRVERNVHRLLDLFDDFPPKVFFSNPTNPSNPRATFFILGWLAERLPQVVREIADRGHEVASHGYGHQLPTKQRPEALRQDLTKSKALLEDITGSTVFGYRAPSFAVSDQIVSVIGDCGFTYDSSYNSFSAHGRYGKLNLADGVADQSVLQIHPGFFEIPVSNLWGGGGYFRLIPSSLFNRGVRHILSKQAAYVFYCHPWEVDPDQPRVEQASAMFRFRHYVNLAQTEDKLRSLMAALSDCQFISCHDLIDHRPIRAAQPTLSKQATKVCESI